MRALIALPLCLLLTACPKNDTVKRCPTTPVTVEVPVPVRVPVPTELTAPVPDPVTRPIETVGDAVQAAERRRAALAVCNGRLTDIGELQ